MQGSRRDDLGTGGLCTVATGLSTLGAPASPLLTDLLLPSSREIPGTKVTKDLLVGRDSLGTLESLVTKATPA